MEVVVAVAGVELEVAAEGAVELESPVHDPGQGLLHLELHGHEGWAPSPAAHRAVEAAFSPFLRWRCDVNERHGHPRSLASRKRPPAMQNSTSVAMSPPTR